MDILKQVENYTWILYVISLIPVVWLLTKFFVNVGADELATVEKKFIGKEMADGRTVALPGEVGIQAKILGPGLHFLIPFIQVAKKHKYLVINTDQVGLVEAITGESMPQGQLMAKVVDSNAFQDGEAFLKAGGQKGPQVNVIPPGEHRINPHLFKVRIQSAVKVGDNQIATVEAVVGEPIAPGRIIAKSVNCLNFQDGAAFLREGGQKGPQVDILPPGLWYINTYMFKVEVDREVHVPDGHIRMVTALDGAQIPDGRLLADKISGHENFQKGEEFLTNGGQKGGQIQHLMPGDYRINPRLFAVSEVVPWVNVMANHVGIVTILEGAPITDPSQIAAEETPLDKHGNFQDADAFLKAGGQKGLQIPVLRPGKYAINPWFAQVEIDEMLEVPMAQCAVVTYFVGDDGEDQTDSSVNARIVENGKKGIWKDPLGPGLHPINRKICRVDLVSINQILLSWADDSSSAHALDSKLKTIVLRTADAFEVNMDVRVIIHISMSNAPKVIANLGSVENLVSDVLEPAISSHFRNSAQKVNALELLSTRSEINEAAEKHIAEVLRKHNVEAINTLIADIVIPERLADTVRDRQIAEQQDQTYQRQMKTEETRKDLEKATAEANLEAKIVESQRSIGINKNEAEAVREKANGEAEATKVKAKADAENRKVLAEADAQATKLKAGADAELISKTGNSEAEVVLAKGKAQAEAYELSVKAMGTDYAKLKMIEEIVKGELKLIPDNIIIGGENGGSVVESFLGISMLEKLTGKPFNGSSETKSDNSVIKKNS